MLWYNGCIECFSNMHDIRLPTPTPNAPHTPCVDEQPLPKVRRRDLRVLRKLGSGSSGKVYLVRDANSNDARALKVVRKVQKDGNRAPERLFREHNILQTLRAARWSMPLLAFWEDATSYHLLMPFYERDLEAELRCHGGKLSLESAVLFMAQILIALDEIHAHGVVHRDVKPANIFLDAQGRLVLGDFGLARAFGTPPAPAQRATLPEWVTENEPVSEDELRYLARTRCGTPAYVAPETYLGMAVSFSVDLWAAAVTLFVMLCGREPWRLSKPDDKPVDLQVMNNPLSFVGCGNVSDGAMRLLRKMLAKQPNQRLTAMAEIQLEPFFVSINWERMRRGEDAAPLNLQRALALHPPPSPDARGARPLLLPSIDAVLADGVGDLAEMAARMAVTNSASPTDISFDL